MQMIRGTGRGRNRKVIEVKECDMILLPPRPDVCQECATQHDPSLPHNAQSLYYQTKFHMQNGRAATWADAMAHCTNDVKERWTKALLEHGVEVPT